MPGFSGRKTYPCKACGKLVTLRSHGLCPSCRAKVLGAKGRKPLASHKKTTGLPGFFDAMLWKLRESGMSYTGRPIAFPTVANVCHILPKRAYKSVAEDEDNIVFLTHGEHTRFDHLVDTLDFAALEKEFPFVWQRAVRQVLGMYRDGKIKETGKILMQILNTYSNEGQFKAKEQRGAPPKDDAWRLV